jgi:hypothetical protein
MMHEFELLLLVKLNRSLVGFAHPEPVVKTNSSLLINAWSPVVKFALGSNPDEMDSVIRVLCQVAIDPTLVFRVSNNPHLVFARQVPTPVPSRCRFRTQTWTACMANYQYLHGLRNAPCWARASMKGLPASSRMTLWLNDGSGLSSTFSEPVFPLIFLPLRSLPFQKFSALAWPTNLRRLRLLHPAPAHV